jgi:hypothetical protein
MVQSQTLLDSRTDTSNPLEASDQAVHPTDHTPSSPAIVPYVELSAPGIQPSHSVQAEKEAAHTTEKETCHAPAEKEFVPDTDGDKEVYVCPHDAKELPTGRDRSPQPSQKNRMCGLPRSWWLVLATFITCIIALAVALGGRFRSETFPCWSESERYCGRCPQPSVLFHPGCFQRELHFDCDSLLWCELDCPALISRLYWRHQGLCTEYRWKVVYRQQHRDI